jgi:caffeoyl-CoA O-methyltransferase
LIFVHYRFLHMAVKGTSTALSAELFEYLTTRFGTDDDLLRDLKRDADAKGIPAIQISEEQSAFMQVFLRSIHARRVLEVGTLAGYSAIVMARALPAVGRVDTIELNPMHAAFARSYVEKAGLSDVVTVFEGAGAEVLPKLVGEPYDFAFLDADKKSYPEYLEHCYRLVRPGGVIAADNAFAFGQLFDATPTDREANSMIAFNDMIAKDNRFQCMIVPVGDGLLMAVKK